jgi:hypothetical protein
MLKLHLVTKMLQLYRIIDGWKIEKSVARQLTIEISFYQSSYSTSTSLLRFNPKMIQITIIQNVFTKNMERTGGTSSGRATITCIC